MLALASMQHESFAVISVTQGLSAGTGFGIGDLALQKDSRLGKAFQHLEPHEGAVHARSGLIAHRDRLHQPLSGSFEDRSAISFISTAKSLDSLNVSKDCRDAICRRQGTRCYYLLLDACL